DGGVVSGEGKQVIGVGEHESIDTKGKPVPQARTLTALCGQYTARRGLLPLFGAEGVQGEEYDLAKHLPADNFHLGRREQVGGREAQVIEYQVKLPDHPDEITLSLDVEPGL